MSNEQLLEVLERFNDSRFAEPLAMLVGVLQDPMARIVSSPRLVPVSKLCDIYVARRDFGRLRGIHVPGLNDFVEVLTSHPDTLWRIVSVSGGGVAGAVFFTEPGDVRACLAGPEATKT